MYFRLCFRNVLRGGCCTCCKLERSIRERKSISAKRQSENSAKGAPKQSKGLCIVYTCVSVSAFACVVWPPWPIKTPTTFGTCAFGFYGNQFFSILLCLCASLNCQCSCPLSKASQINWQRFPSLNFFWYMTIFLI